MDDDYIVLGSYLDGDLKITHESRPKEFLGPQKACHPEALEISVVTRGSADALLGGRPDRLHAGLYGVVPAGVEHSSWTDRGAVECNVHLPTPLLERALDDAGLKGPFAPAAGSFPIPPEGDHLMAALAAAVDRQDRPGGRLLIESLCLSLSAWLVAEAAGGPAAPRREGSVTGRRARRAEELMRAAPERSFTVDELAEVAGMSRFRFLRAFKEELGVSPYAYLLRLRVERGAELIATTDLPLTRIAVDLGFSSSGRFTDAFKRVHGFPPSLLRTNRKAEGARFGKPEPSARRTMADA